jgi:hypothetical protein
MDKNEIFDIVKDQIISSFNHPKVNCSDHIGIQIEEDSELIINKKLEIFFTFKPFENISFDSMKLFFLDRLNFPYTRTYVDKDRIRIFITDYKRPKEEVNSLNSLAFAMESYKHFKEVYNAFMKFQKLNRC